LECLRTFAHVGIDANWHDLGSPAECVKDRESREMTMEIICPITDIL
jgi:hypothetical protein